MKTVIRGINKADQNLFLIINRLQTSWQNMCFLFLTNLGCLCFQTVLTLVLILIPSTRNAGLKYGLIQLAVSANVQIIKRMVSRVRPYNTLENINPLRTEKDYSFPSGHTAAAFTTALTLNSLIPATSTVCYALAILIGYSRVYIGVHYPSDVIAGGLIGLCITKFLLLVS